MQENELVLRHRKRPMHQNEQNLLRRMSLLQHPGLVLRRSR